VHRSTWKRGESVLGKFFDTTRTPLSGGNSKHTRSDTLHASLFFEMKKGKHVPRKFSSIERLYLDTEIKARREGKIPIVVLREEGASAPTGEWLGWIRTGYFGESNYNFLVAMSLADIRSCFRSTPPNKPTTTSVVAASSATDGSGESPPPGATPDGDGRAGPRSRADGMSPGDAVLPRGDRPSAHFNSSRA
jgi:hypothetical protein